MENSNNIREAAAQAAREWFDQKTTSTQLAACEAGYLLGHAAGVADGVREFAEWFDDKYDEVISHFVRKRGVRFRAGTGEMEGR
jgi:hypothetical protein